MWNIIREWTTISRTAGTIQAIALLLIALISGNFATAAAPDFDKQIAPLIIAKCVDCHSGDKPKGGLDITRKENVEPAELWKRVKTGEMPPKKQLPASEVQLFKEWIESGAKWGRDPIDPFAHTTSHRAGLDWWALQPVKRPTLSGTTHPVDSFVIAKLRDKGLSLSPEADRRTLIRRVYFDLIGLPPTPEEVHAFVNDKTANAYERVIDRLLASPHYGERWARHWLDVVRFGETDGFERNTSRPNAWHYRDWVIRALNADMPYDHFARLQLAGDVIEPGNPDAIKATGFLVAGVHNTVLGNERMRAVARQDELEDIVGSVSQTFLGLTVNCARCHDHKFDPISHVDYYRLAASLSGVGFGNRTLPNNQARSEIARLTQELDHAKQVLEVIESPARAALMKTKGIEKPDRIIPSPVAAWDFRKSADDIVGNLKATAFGNAKLTPEGVLLDGKTGYLRTSPLPFELKAKSLEVWVKLSTLNQRGGGVLTVQTIDGKEFDSIVYGEQEPQRWMAGSDFFRRSKSFSASDETSATKHFVHLLITYAQDGTITCYRNGKPYGKSYVSSGPVAFASGKAVMTFGCRHEPANGNKMLAATLRHARVYDTALSPEVVSELFNAGDEYFTDSEIHSKLMFWQRLIRTLLQQKTSQFTTKINELQQQTANEQAYAIAPQNPGISRILARGDVEQPGAVIAPSGIAAIPTLIAEFGLAADAPDADRRRKLAEWVTSPRNPLFARIIVNRVWHHHFGTGIVETPSDFGFNGGQPSHPELLDWLAAELKISTQTKNGVPWSLKRLHKIIVSSATYRQSSAPNQTAQSLDADNRLLWRFQPRRLEGELIRDSMLAVAGLLNHEVGGKGFNDYQERNFNGTSYFQPIDHSDPEFQRRSIYRFVPRGGNQGLLDTFDCPDPAAAAPRRNITTTPLQALTLWNSDFALRVSEAFATRITKEAMGVEQQVTRAWQLAYQRNPTPEETRLATALVKQHGLKALCRALFNSNEFVTVE